MVFELYLKYAQNNLLERAYDAFLGLYLASQSSYAALNQRRKISHSTAFIAYVEHLYTPYIFLVMCVGKERKKERKKEQNRYFYGQFTRLGERLVKAWEHFLS